jgi:hypothetical protein
MGASWTWWVRIPALVLAAAAAAAGALEVADWAVALPAATVLAFVAKGFGYAGRRRAGNATGPARPARAAASDSPRAEAWAPPAIDDAA